MKKITNVIWINPHITVVFEDGSVLTSSSCTEEMYQELMDDKIEDTARRLFEPKKKAIVDTNKNMTELLNDMHSSKYLTVKGSSVYLESICQISLPVDFAEAFYSAEKENNTELIQSYLNFWTLCSLNPDSRARTNLFWFLNKYDMLISRSGLFVAYRNVKVKKEGSGINAELAKFVSDSYVKIKFKWKKSPKNYYVTQDEDGKNIVKEIKSLPEDSRDIPMNLQEFYNSLSEEEEATVYTDGYTGEFDIRLGEVVSMPREDCDSKQENTCSRGLHVASKGWLTSNYFGNVSLMVLVNPADVVAVPPDDSYGKMRTCAYYPVSVVEWEDGKIKNPIDSSGFEDDFMDKITYQGDINDEEDTVYQLIIPTIPEISRDQILRRLDQIKGKVMAKQIFHEDELFEEDENWFDEEDEWEDK